ncbi:DapH/DapD/GlmU-related protein [Flavimobilis marinus]
MTARFASIALHRAASRLGRRFPLAASMLKQINQAATGADLAWQARIGPGAILFHPQGVVIGQTVTIGARCQIQQGVTIGGLGQAGAIVTPMPMIGSGVRIGAGARILGGVKIGDDANIGANAVVLIDVPPGRTAVGVPARIR